MFSDILERQAEKLLADCRAKGLKLATAESCTGGLVASLLTHIAGSSDVVECGFITYSNHSKNNLLGVSADLIHENGAVSSVAAQHMAIGALNRAGVDVSLSITGIAGPSGGSDAKPVGLVYIAVAKKFGGTEVQEFRFSGSRQNIRLSAVREALRMLERAV